MIRKVYTNIAHFNVPIEWLLIMFISLKTSANERSSADAFRLENIYRFENKERVGGRWQGNIFYKYTDWIHPIIIMAKP